MKKSSDKYEILYIDNISRINYTVIRKIARRNVKICIFKHSAGVKAEKACNTRSDTRKKNPDALPSRLRLGN